MTKQLSSGPNTVGLGTNFPTQAIRVSIHAIAASLLKIAQYCVKGLYYRAGLWNHDPPEREQDDMLACYPAEQT